MKDVYVIKMYVNNIVHDYLMINKDQLKMLNWLIENDWIKNDSNFEIQNNCSFPIEIDW